VGTSCGEARHAANACDIKVFCCPKLGNSLEEYEDAWAHRQTRTPVGIRVAVTDGATESSFAKLWAVLLAESYVRSELGGAEFFARQTSRPVSLRETLPVGSPGGEPSKAGYARRSRR